MSIEEGMCVSIILTIRQSEFISLLIQESNYQTMQYYAELLEVSTKTLQNELPVIEKYLQEHEIEVIRQRGIGIKLDKNEVEDMTLMNILQNQINSEKPMSITKRRRDLLYKLLNESSDYTSIQQLSDLYFVSKSSIVNDLKSIENWIISNGLQIERTMDGTKISGDEKDIRKAIANSINDFPPTSELILINDLESRLEHATHLNLVEMFGVASVSFIEDLVSKVEILLNYNIAEPYYLNFVTHLLIAIERVSSGNIISEETELIASEHSRTVYYICQEIEQRFDLGIPNVEHNYIHQYLLGSSLNNSKNIRANTNIGEECKELVRLVSKLTGIDFRGDDLLLESLEMHLRPLWNRLEYNIGIENPLLAMIEQEYGKLLLACDFVIRMKSSYFTKYEVSRSEIAYITTYFQASIERTEKDLKVLVVCHSGFGTSQLLMGKLLRAFPNWIIPKTTSIGKLANLDIEDYDFIVSTVEILNSPKPYVLVSALLSKNEITKIEGFVQNVKHKAEMCHINFDYQLEPKKVVPSSNLFRIDESLNIQYKVRNTDELCIDLDEGHRILEISGSETFISDFIGMIYKCPINILVEKIEFRLKERGVTWI